MKEKDSDYCDYLEELVNKDINKKYKEFQKRKELDTKKTNIDYWEDLLKELPEQYQEWLEKEREYLLSNIQKGSKVLDVGCGAGRTIKDLIEKTQNITGIDHSKNAVERAKKYFINYPTIDILTADATDLPFKDNYFDDVTCMTTFANFGRKKYKALKEMKRVLKKDGRVYLSVFSEDAFPTRMEVYKKSYCPIKKIKGTTVYFNKAIEDYVSEQFSKKQLRKIFKKVGLKVEEIIKAGIGYICKLRK